MIPPFQKIKSQESAKIVLAYFAHPFKLPIYPPVLFTWRDLFG
jgi:hypothetical protein